MDDPWSRPPGAKNMKTLLTKALNELVVVTDNGGRRMVTKREAIVTQLVNRSAKADFKAIQILLGMLRDIGGDNDTHPSDQVEQMRGAALERHFRQPAFDALGHGRRWCNSIDANLLRRIGDGHRTGDCGDPTFRRRVAIAAGDPHKRNIRAHVDH